MFRARMNCFKHQISPNLLAWLLLAAMLMVSASTRADVIYREIFGRPAPSSAVNTNVVFFGWREFVTAGTVLATQVGVNGSDNGKPTDVANVNANTNLDGTIDALALGWHYHDQNPLCLSFTPEYSFNPADYVAGSVVFSWYQGNANVAHKVQLLIRVGGVWYVSAQIFNNTAAVANAAAFGNGAELKSLAFNPTASNWRLLNFNGDYNIATGVTVNSALGNLSVGAAPATDLSGPITAFGFYSDNGGVSGNRRFDTFTIQATSMSSMIGSTLTWQGLQTIDWDTQAANWALPGGTSTNYTDGDAARFDDTAGGASTINIPGLVLPGSLTVSNSLVSFLLSGPGQIAGGTSLLKQGPGMLTLAAQITASGATTISNGIVQIGDGGTVGSLGTGPVTNYGTLAYFRSDTVTVAKSIAGNGTIQQNGAGTLVLSGTNTFSGATVVNAGSLILKGTLGGVLSNAVGTVLGGTGTNTGLVAVSGNLSPGASAGTFTAGALSMDPGAAVTFEIGTNNVVGGGVNDLIQVNGNLTLNDNVLSIALLGVPKTGVPYRLINYTGARTGSFAPVVALIGGGRFGATLSYDDGNKQVNITFTGGPATLRWNSSADATWDIGISSNWFNLGNNQADVFLSLDNVLLDDTPGLQTFLDIGVNTIVPLSITNKSDNNAYSIGGVGKISGTGGFVKQGSSTLTLTTANDFSGGMNIQGGAVRLGALTAAGTGTITVNSNAVLVAGAAHTNTLVLAGGSIGAVSGLASIAGSDVTAVTGTLSRIYMTDPQSTSVNSEMNFTGNLHGGGDILVISGDSNPSPDPGVGFRLRGTGASDYSGTITLSNSVKGELQTVAVTPFSPAGTGKFVLVCGNYDGGTTLTGNYSEFNIRNNGTTNATLGNSMELSGTGFAVINMLGSGPVNAISTMGNLKIGGGQELGVLRNSGNVHIVAFQTVTLSGGTARFSPKTAGFGTDASPGSDLSLGRITELTAGSGINMAGVRNLFLTGTNTYTGNTVVSSGTLALMGTASFSNSPAISIASGATLSATGRTDGKLTLSSGQTLSGSGSVSGALDVGTGATLSPGDTGVGTMAVSGSTTFKGNCLMEIDKASTTQDLVSSAAAVLYGGTLTVTNLSNGANPYAPGDSFKLFNSTTATYAGSFSAIVPSSPGAGMEWDASSLIVDGTLKVKSAVSAPPGITGVTVIGGNLVFTGTNGSSGASYSILTTTNVGLPLSSWTTQSVGTFGGSGNFSVTNAVNPSLKSQFFLIKLP